MAACPLEVLKCSSSNGASTEPHSTLQVVYGLAWQWQPGDRLLTSVAEYGSNMIAYLQVRLALPTQG